MLFNDTIFLGIDPTAGRRPFVYSAIDNDLNLHAFNQGTIDDVLAFAAGQRKAIAAICAPQRPNQGLMADEDIRQRVLPTPAPGRWEDYRLADYILWQHNIKIPRTPRDLDGCPGWMLMGFHLYQRLRELGYREFPDENAACQFVEVYPHACYSTLLGIIPFHKNSLEGRIQRQLILYELGLPVMDPMRLFEEITRYRLLNGVLLLDPLYQPEELDALVAAYTAWMAVTKPNQVMKIGDPVEGQITLPVADLKEHYS